MEISSNWIDIFIKSADFSFLINETTMSRCNYCSWPCISFQLSKSKEHFVYLDQFNVTVG